MNQFVYKVDFEYLSPKAREVRDAKFDDPVGLKEFEKFSETIRDTLYIGIDNPLAIGIIPVLEHYIGKADKINLHIHSVEYVCQPLQIRE